MAETHQVKVKSNWQGYIYVESNLKSSETHRYRGETSNSTEFRPVYIRVSAISICIYISVGVRVKPAIPPNFGLYIFGITNAIQALGAWFYPSYVEPCHLVLRILVDTSWYPCLRVHLSSFLVHFVSAPVSHIFCHLVIVSCSLQLVD